MSGSSSTSSTSAMTGDRHAAAPGLGAPPQAERPMDTAPCLGGAAAEVTAVRHVPVDVPARVPTPYRGGVPTAALRTFSASAFAPDHLVAAKGARTISVCLPARDEAATVGPIVATIVEELVDKWP